MTRYKHIDTHFPKEDDDLFEYVHSLANDWGDVSQIMRRAIECLRLFNGSLEQAQAAANALIIVNNQYGSVDAAMNEHQSLFREVTK